VLLFCKSPAACRTVVSHSHITATSVPILESVAIQHRQCRPQCLYPCVRTRDLPLLTVLFGRSIVRVGSAVHANVSLSRLQDHHLSRHFQAVLLLVRASKFIHHRCWRGQNFRANIYPSPSAEPVRLLQCDVHALCVPICIELVWGIEVVCST
jgi:hypothetical protein